MTNVDISKKIKELILKVILFFTIESIILYLLYSYSILNINWDFNSLIIGISFIVLGIYFSFFNVKLAIWITELNDKRIIDLSEKIKTAISNRTDSKISDEQLDKLYIDIKKEFDKLNFNGKYINKISLFLIVFGSIVAIISLLKLMNLIPFTNMFLK